MEAIANYMYTAHDDDNGDVCRQEQQAHLCPHFSFLYIGADMTGSKWGGYIPPLPLHIPYSWKTLSHLFFDMTRGGKPSPDSTGTACLLVGIRDYQGFQKPQGLWVGEGMGQGRDFVPLTNPYPWCGSGVYP